MLLIYKILKPKLRTDLSIFHQKHDRIGVEFKTSKNKTEISTQLKISYNRYKFNKTEFVEKLALSVDFAQSHYSNIVHMGDYKIIY